MYGKRFVGTLVFFICLSYTSQVSAQTNTLKTVPKAKKTPPITQEFSAGIRVLTDGYSVFAERGFINPDENTTRFVWIEFAEKKHPKEAKQLNETFPVLFPNEPVPLPYRYGKINNFYQMKLGYGNKKAITGRLDKKSVIVSWVYGGALSLGFLKPYNLDILVPEGNNTFSRQVVDYYDTDTREYFLDETLIIGGTYFPEGIANLKLQPGLLAKSGFYFDLSPTPKSYLGVEIGSSLELYAKNIEIMANTRNNFYFLNLYVDVRFGKRWSR